MIKVELNAHALAAMSDMRKLRGSTMSMLSQWMRAVARKSHLARVGAHLLRRHNSIYHPDYYERTVEGPAVKSAPIMAASMLEVFHPRTVVDVGCGTGALLDAFRHLGCQVNGLEYSDAGLAYCHKRRLPVRKFNVTRDQIDGPRYDLAVSFEVAEHLPSWAAARYVDLLCRLSPLIVMSAATPGSGGTDHINEQPHSYWIDRFEQRGYSFDQRNSARLSSQWKEAGTAYWYSDNVLVFNASRR
ncbi:MAG: methyltransferase domain-containing protein [Xanthobacteraceae bacterium]